MRQRTETSSELIGYLPAAELMRRDFSHLKSTESDGASRIEIYGFDPPAVTAGRFSRVSDDDIETWRRSGHEFARRPTGGGILRHGSDLCFGAAFVDSRVGTAAAYARVAACVQAALLRHGVEATPTFSRAGGRAERCFDRALGAELLCRGTKILGLAARRMRNAVLVQGSISTSREDAAHAALVGVGRELGILDLGVDIGLFARDLKMELEKSL